MRSFIVAAIATLSVGALAHMSTTQATAQDPT
jgi:hypothetical protein